MMSVCCCEGSVEMFWSDQERPSRPRMLLAYSDSAYASRCVRHFRRLGWEVRMVASGVEAQRLVEQVAPHVVVLDVDLADETGWLSSAKMLMRRPELKVVLTTGEGQAHFFERAATLGAAGAIRRE